MHKVQIFRMPSTIHFGQNAAAFVGREVLRLRCNTPFLVTDKFLLQAGILEPVLNSLKEIGIKPVLYDAVSAEPTLQHVNDGLELFQKERCDLLLSCGGGSVIDTAKAIAALATNQGNITDFMGIGKIKNNCRPHIAIPTTAGTGSEATPTTIITDTKNNVKMLVISEKLIPDVAIVDPLLTLKMPQSITAGTGLDALVHAIEAYVSVKATSMSDDFALSAITLLGANLPVAWSNPDNLEARSHTMLGALKAGISFANSSVALVHGMSRPLGALFHIPHGISNATLLTAVTRFSIPGNPTRYSRIGQALGLDTKTLHPLKGAHLAADFIEDLVHTLKCPSLSGLGITKDQLDENVEKMANDAIASGSPGNNPRRATLAEIVELYYAVL